MNHRDASPKRRGDSPVPSGSWTIAGPGDAPGPEDQQVYAVRGDTIRVMWDFGVQIPLWDEYGLLPDEPGWLRSALGLSAPLIRDLGEWGSAMCYLDEHRRIGSGRAYRDLDREARRLVERLRAELGSRFTVTYDPWRVA